MVILNSNKTTRTVLILGFYLSLVLCGCHQTRPKVYDPSQVKFSVEYSPLFESQFYPSLVMGAASLSDPAYGLTDSGSLFSVSVTAPVSNAVLRISIDSSKLNYVTIFQEVLPVKDMRYTFYPTIKWKYDQLYRTRQQGVADLTFTCFINDEEVDVKNLRLNYRSANDCLLSVRDDAGRNHDYRWLFAAYVNEEHPYIDSILSGILSQGVVRKITGYQGDAKSVVSQVEAIWYYALERGITYSSISCTSTPTIRSNVQHIRFFDEVYNSRQANCVDACVFFASIMRKIGLKPVIFVEPCHAYLGYYTDKGRRNLRLLETTITAWADFPALTRDHKAVMEANPNAQGKDRISSAMNSKYLKYLTDDEKKKWENNQMDFETFKRAVAHSLFVKASEYDKENYKNNKKLFASADNLQYQQLDIEQLRKIVQPIN
ncbi:MAG: hypothetical protein IJK84_08005 [Bacteroidales bacterium]|nr:hypothetical protein [Bacteroidales bacterium]